MKQDCLPELCYRIFPQYLQENTIQEYEILTASSVSQSLSHSAGANLNAAKLDDKF
jgi:hypothetical protein